MHFSLCYGFALSARAIASSSILERNAHQIGGIRLLDLKIRTQPDAGAATDIEYLALMHPNFDTLPAFPKFKAMFSRSEGAKIRAFYEDVYFAYPRIAGTLPLQNCRLYLDQTDTARSWLALWTRPWEPPEHRAMLAGYSR
jgi:hypothetical protein